VVLLVLEPDAVADALLVAQSANAAVWIGSDAMTHEEHFRRASGGLNISRFAYPLSGASPDVVEDAVATIAEHHPGETVWLQRPSLV
jgi:hypothetical protein